jgi:hypothetical protein
MSRKRNRVPWSARQGEPRGAKPQGPYSSLNGLPSRYSLSRPFQFFSSSGLSPRAIAFSCHWMASLKSPHSVWAAARALSGRAEAVVAQAEVAVPGAMAVLAVGAAVVGPCDAEGAVDGDQGAAQVEEELGRAEAAGAGDAGAWVPPSFRPSRPVWGAAAARARARRRSSTSPKGCRSGASMRAAARWRRAWSAAGRSRSLRARLRVSRPSGVVAGAGSGRCNMAATLQLRPSAGTGLRRSPQLIPTAAIFHQTS